MLSSGDFPAVDIRRKTEKLQAMEAENTKLKASIYQLQKAEAESEKLVSGMGWISATSEFVSFRRQGSETVYDSLWDSMRLVS